ncbi:MAG TPA: UvrD-helicase domain-containing protein, partial [Nitrospinota bacterium]|nr:UvrD-helicase domain-containing protein [Nitrospinota bacterium]
MASPDMSPTAAEAPLADAEDRLRAVTTFDRNVVVTAGAGTGKTALLTERLLNLFFRRLEPARPSECAALTFTRKAAGEMAERLREYLERFVAWSAGEGPPAESGEVAAGIYRSLGARYERTHEELGRIARETLRDLEMLPISTYHSFAARLLRLYPLEAGVDPNFVDDDGMVFEERFDRHWRAWLAGELGEEAPRGPLWEKALDELDLSVLEALAKQLCSESLPLDDIERALADGTLFAAPAGWLEGVAAEAGILASKHPGDRKVEVSIRKSVELLEAFQEGIPEEGLSGIREDIDARPGKLKAMTEEDYRACLRVIKIARDIGSLKRSAISNSLRLVLPFARKFRRDFVLAGHLHFDSQLARARDLLRDHPEIRRALKDRIRRLLVDEFQDTDPIQYEIVLFLAEEREGEATSWRDVRLEPGKLFIVGDPKQSIYKFRGADIEAYQGLLDDVLREPPLELTVNFRSHDRIVDVVNGLFEKLIHARENVQPAYQAARPRPGGPANLESQGVEVRVTRPEGDETWDAEEATRREAREIARMIREDWVGGGAGIPGPENGARPVEYGDIALLFRKMTHVGAYIDALREHGIPYVSEFARGFFETQEVTDFLNLLACLVYPEDRLALAGVLRSPIGGLTDKELVAWRREAEIPPKASAMDERLRAVRRTIRPLPVSEALDRVLAGFPVLESAILLAGEQGRSNVLKIRSLALERERSLDVGFSGLVDWLRAQGRETRDEGESPLAEENINAVKVLTVHKAKGLEFPIVILAGLQAGSRQMASPVRVGRDWTTGRWALQIGAVRTPQMAWANERDIRLEEAEERRLFYVAATRARERLVLSAAVRHERGKPAKAEGILAGLKEALEIDVREAEAGALPIGDGRISLAHVTSGAQGGPIPAPRDEAPMPTEALGKTWEARKRRAEQIRATTLDLRPSDLDPDKGRDGDDPRGRTLPDEARRIGIVAHAAME